MLHEKNLNNIYENKTKEAVVKMRLAKFLKHLIFSFPLGFRSVTKYHSL